MWTEGAQEKSLDLQRQEEKEHHMSSMALISLPLMMLDETTLHTTNCYLNEFLHHNPVHSVSSSCDVTVTIAGSLEVIESTLESITVHHVLVGLVSQPDELVHLIVKDTVLVSEVVPRVTAEGLLTCYHILCVCMCVCGGGGGGGGAGGGGIDL